MLRLASKLLCDALRRFLNRSSNPGFTNFLVSKSSSLMRFSDLATPLPLPKFSKQQPLQGPVFVKTIFHRL